MTPLWCNLDNAAEMGVSVDVRLFSVVRVGTPVACDNNAQDRGTEL